MPELSAPSALPSLPAGMEYLAVFVPVPHPADEAERQRWQKAISEGALAGLRSARRGGREEVQLALDFVHAVQQTVTASNGDRRPGERRANATPREHTQ